MKEPIICLCLLLWIGLQSSMAQVADTVYTRRHFLPENIVNSEAYRMTHISLPLMIVGLSTVNRDKRFRSMRNSYIPTLRYHHDDYLQYAPAVLLTGLKASGVEGASTWSKMLTTDALSVGILAITVNSLKLSTNRLRPDRTDHKSFPSGHSATAFMTATMLHKEYGLTRSPFYSIAGYSLATATALSRQLNNKHWFSDVLVGAGIGIVSTEMGYFLADQIFGNRGRIRQDKAYKPYVTDKKYGYLGLQTGYGIRANIKLPHNIEIGQLQGVYAALTGAGYFSDHWGVAGKAAFSQAAPDFKYKTYFALHPEADVKTDQVLSKSLTYSNFVLGLEYSTQVIPGIQAGGSVLGGVAWAGSYRIDFVKETDFYSTRTLFKTDSHMIPNIDLNCHLQRFVHTHMGVKLFFNYNLGFSDSHYSYYPLAENPIYGKGRYNLHSFAFGAEVSALLWRK